MNLVPSIEQEGRFDANPLTRPVSVKATELTLHPLNFVSEVDENLESGNLIAFYNVHLDGQEFYSGNKHAFEVTACIGGKIEALTLYGNNSLSPGTNYGLCLNYCEGLQIENIIAFNFRNGVVVGSCNGIFLYGCKFSGNETAISVRNGSSNVDISHCEGDSLVIGNITWKGAPRDVTVTNCVFTKIEVQGACRSIKLVNCEVKEGIQIAQIFDSRFNQEGIQEMYVPEVMIESCRFKRLTYYTINSLGTAISRPFEGKVTVDNVQWNGKMLLG